MKKSMKFVFAGVLFLLVGCVQVSNQLDAYFEKVDKDVIFSASVSSILASDCQIIYSDKSTGIVTFKASKNPLFQNNEISGTIRIEKSKTNDVVNISVKAILPGQMIDMTNGPGSLIRKVLKNIESEAKASANIISNTK